MALLLLAVAPRLLSVLGTLVPIALSLLVPAPGSWLWLAPATAVVLGLVLALIRPRAWGLVLLGTMMVVLATQLGAQTRDALRITREAADEQTSWPTVDLTTERLPSDAAGYLAVRGFLRNEWTLDEYDVAQGRHPNQNEPARAVLVVVAGSQDDVLTLDGPIVVARIDPALLGSTGIRIVRGRIEPVADQILATLVQVSADVPSERVRGILIDTLALPTPREAWTRLALTLFSGLVGLGCLWFATTSSRA